MKGDTPTNKEARSKRAGSSMHKGTMGSGRTVTAKKGTMGNGSGNCGVSGAMGKHQKTGSGT